MKTLYFIQLMLVVNDVKTIVVASANQLNNYGCDSGSHSQVAVL